MNGIRRCDHCGRSYTFKNTLSKYCSRACSYRARKTDPEWLERRRAKGRSYQRDRYQQNAEPIKAKESARRASRQRFLVAVKTTCGCIDCGTRDGELHFDHRSGDDKRFTLARGQSHSWLVILAEIEKCDVRCAPCHVRRHKERIGLEGRADRHAAHQREYRQRRKIVYERST
jgi:hypothetical protein